MRLSDAMHSTSAEMDWSRRCHGRQETATRGFPERSTSRCQRMGAESIPGRCRYNIRAVPAGSWRSAPVTVAQHLGAWLTRNVRFRTSGGTFGPLRSGRPQTEDRRRSHSNDVPFRIGRARSPSARSEQRARSVRADQSESSSRQHGPFHPARSTRSEKFEANRQKLPKDRCGKGFPSDTHGHAFEPRTTSVTEQE